jgi:hypothetical protein
MFTIPASVVGATPFTIVGFAPSSPAPKIQDLLMTRFSLYSPRHLDGVAIAGSIHRRLMDWNSTGRWNHNRLHHHQKYNTTSASYQPIRQVLPSLITDGSAYPAVGSGKSGWLGSLPSSNHRWTLQTKALLL